MIIKGDNHFMGKKYFRFLSGLYAFFALVTAGFCIYLIVSGKAPEYAAKYLDIRATAPVEVDLNILVGIIFTLETLVNLWLSWLVGRIGKGTSRGTFVMVFEILVIALNIYALFRTGMNWDTIVKIALAALTLVMVISARNGN